MPNKNFLLLSMEDTKIKKVSNVISNDSCRKILDYLSDKEATETELAEKLSIPISTVHYNLQQLIETGLISAEEFHYSEKGKEVSHYKLANKYIIIAPKKTFGIKEKLRNILPVALIASAAALFIQYFQKFFAYGGTTSIFTETKQILVRETMITQKVGDSAPFAKEAAVAGASAMQKMQEDVVKTATSALQNITNKTAEYVLAPKVTTSTVTVPPSIWQNIALWFFVGAIFALIVYFVYGVRKKNVEQ